MRQPRLPATTITALGAVLALTSTGWAYAADPDPAAPPVAVTPTSATATAPDASLENKIPEVVVEAPEPRYAMPTLRDRIGRIWAPVLIDGKGPFRLVLDTGANRSAVTTSIVQSLGSTVRKSKPLLVHGVTGSAIVPAIHVGEMEFGELMVKSSVLPIVPDVFGGAEGILGKEGFEDKRIFVDFGHDRLVISRSHKERAPPGFATVPVRVQHDGLLIAEVRIGSVKAKAVIDTGGQQTCGNLALRDALLRHAKDQPLSNEIIGVTLDRQTGQTLPIPPLNFGSVEIRNMTVMLGDISMFQQWKLIKEPALLIGMDVLGSVDTLIIDYKLKELQIRLRGGSGGRNPLTAGL